MNITKARTVAKNPEVYTEQELHESLDVIVNDDRFSEGQVTKFQAAIEAELKARDSIKLTSDTLLFEMNRVIWAIQESNRPGSWEDAEAMRAIRDRSFNYTAMGIEA